MSATIRDITIILLAVQVLIVNILLAILIWQVYRLFQIVRREIKPMVDDAYDTINILKDTAVFVGDTVVEPVIRSSRSVVGFRATVRSLTSDINLKPSSRRSAPRKREQPRPPGVTEGVPTGAEE
ncbi:MAG: hypothetical protein KDD92_07910 [Caldilineaceae bacterium]|nr:hypothetical protein [Caldilineaceae bacterium]